MSFNLKSGRGNVVTFECEGLRELKPNERIHLIHDEQQAECIICGKFTYVWTDDVSLWHRSTARCI